MPRKCKFDRTVKCDETECTPDCQIWRASGQQTLTLPQPKPIKTVKHKGITTKYYKVKK